MLRRIAGFVAVAAVLFAGTGSARIFHLHAAHPHTPRSAETPHIDCRQHKSPAGESPDPAPHSSDHCEVCFLISAALKGPAPVPTVLPRFDVAVVERFVLSRATYVAPVRLDAASPRGPPSISV